jgi:hypothetical protein
MVHHLILALPDDDVNSGHISSMKRLFEHALQAATFAS